MQEYPQNMFVIQGCDEAEANTIVRPIISYWQDAWRRLRKNPLAMAALVTLLVVILLVVVGPMVSGHNFAKINGKIKNKPPSWTYLFGTDLMGRDMFTRVWLGCRVSIIVALVCTSIQLFIGALVGGVMAYFGGWVDEILMRVIEILASIPSLLVTMLIMVVLGHGMVSLLFAMCAISWVGLARQVRGLVLQLRESEFVIAAEALGSPRGRTIVKHLLPNAMGILILNAAMSIPGFIFTEAALSFLGMGLQLPHLSLGVLISMGQQAMEFYPYQLFFPAGILCLIVLAFNLLGDGLRDALDPKMRQ